MLSPHITGAAPVTALISSHASIASDRRRSSAIVSRNSAALTPVGAVFGSLMLHPQVDAVGQTVRVGGDERADGPSQPRDLRTNGDDVLVVAVERAAEPARADPGRSRTVQQREDLGVPWGER